MDRDSRILAAAAEEYHLDINGVRFWTPYWVNRNTPPYFYGAPYAAKGTPGQLKKVLLEKLKQTSNKPKTPEAYRKFMRQFGLGIDCSALAYDVLSRLLREGYGLRLADHVFAPKAEIIKASQRPIWQRAGVSPQTLKALGNYISVAKVHELFGVNQKWITDVARLTSQQTSSTVADLSQARPGDMIKMSGVRYAHTGVIVDVRPGLLRYVDSSREWSRYGGARLVDIKITASGGLEKQDWEDKRFFFIEKGDRLCRLKVLDGRS